MPACLSVTLFLLSLSLSCNNGAMGLMGLKLKNPKIQLDRRTDGNRWKIEIEIEITKLVVLWRYPRETKGDEGQSEEKAFGAAPRPWWV